ARAMKEPGDGHVRGRVSDARRERLVALELSAVLLEELLLPLAPASAAALRLLQRAPEKAARERAPRKDADAVLPARGQDLELDGAGVQVVEALLADKPEKMPRLRRLARARDVPAREVAASDVEHLALLDEELHRLPDLVPRRIAVDVVHLVKVDAIGLQ